MAVWLVFLAAAMPAAAWPAQLQRLTVDSFTLSSDSAQPQIEVPFHLIITLHVRQNVTQIDDLELPILAELELLGDERRLETVRDGTNYRETISVVAHHTGTIAIAPATLQAIDGRDGRPKQFYSNGLKLQVVGGSLEPLQSAQSFGRSAFAVLVRVLAWTAGVICTIVLLVLLFRTRAAPTPAVIAPPAPAPVVVRSMRHQLGDALTVLRAERSRGAAVAVRAAVWRMVGASDGETLADVLHRPQAADPTTSQLLRALERAAFTYDADLPAAIDAACVALEGSLA
ncbi:MAG TPA: hypothetical protein VNG31_01660 [Candidatus Baltobacteraceae bacterium]|nr:hypothetical protein [Candidatus Baltobacteraceae bacterium]